MVFHYLLYVTSVIISINNYTYTRLSPSPPYHPLPNSLLKNEISLYSTVRLMTIMLYLLYLYLLAWHEMQMSKRSSPIRYFPMLNYQDLNTDEF